MIIPSEKKHWRRARRRGQVGWGRLRAKPGVERGLRYLNYAFFAAIVAFLLHRLSQVGWSDVFASLPVSPWFYLFFFLRFISLPISELAIYEIIWSKPLLRHILVFVRKRVYNYAVLGYSGEAFLTLWARRRLALSDKQVIVGVKDNALLSAFASNSATVLLIFALAFTGTLSAGLDAFPGAGVLFALAFLSATTLASLFVIFRHKLVAVPVAQMPLVLSVHGVRQALMITLHAAMYSAALPGAPITAWLVFIAMQLVLSRVPFLPNQEIVYLTAALTLAPIVGAPEAAVAGMLIAEAGLSQIFNAVFFVLTAPLARVSRPKSPAGPGKPDADPETAR